jgi:hypothetical protein
MEFFSLFHFWVNGKILNVALFWDIAPCSPYVNRLFRGTYHLHLHGRKLGEQETSVQLVARKKSDFLLG